MRRYEDIVKSCEHKTWNLALIDYTISGLGGVYAIELLNTIAPNLPAIMVSDVMGEDAAIASMKAGAEDYFIKGQYARLIPTMERALRNAKIRVEKAQMEAALRVSEERYRTLVENAPAAIVVYQQDEVVYANQVAVDEIGASNAQDIIGRSPLEFINPSHHDLAEEHAARAKKEPQPPIEEKLIRFDGEIIHVEIISAPIDYQGQSSILAIITNITERRQAEKDLKTFTRNLEQRAVQLQVAAEVARDAASSNNLEQLLNRAVNLLQRRFGLYFASIYLVEKSNPFAVLAAATGDAGQAMLANQHKLEIGEVGIVGHVAATGKPRIASNVDKDTAHFVNPWLPKTRSEMALPLKVGEEIIGVIDIQSQAENSFNQDDLQILQILADQLAVAINNIKLYAASQSRTQELRSLYDIALATGSALETDLLLSRLYKHVKQLLKPDAFLVTSYDEKTKKIHIDLAMEMDNPLLDLQGAYLPLEKSGLAGWVVRKRRPLLVRDTKKDTLPVAPIFGFEKKTTRSWLGVPLIARGRTVGSIVVQSFQAHAFTEEHCQLLESLATQVAVAIENARLFEAERKQLLLAQSLQQVGSLLTSELGLDEVLNKIIDLLGQVIEFDSATIQLLDTDQKLSMTATRGLLEPGLAKRITEQLGDDVLTQRMLARKIAVIPDTKMDQRWIKIPGSEYIRSWIGAPLLAHGSLIGFLNIDSKTAQAYNEDMEETVMAFASQAAIAIENARLFEAEHAARERSEALRAAAQLINSTLSLDQIIETVLEQLARVLPFDSGCVIIVDDKQAIVRAGIGYEEFYKSVHFSNTTFDLDDETVGHVLRTGAPLMLANTHQDARWVKMPLSAHVQSWLGVPLLARDQTLGLLCLDRVSKQGFSSQEIEVAQLFAAHSAAAIDNARLFEDVEQRATELEAERRYLALLYDMGKSLALSINPHHILRQAVELTCQVLDGTNSVALIYDPGTELFSPAAAYDNALGFITEMGLGPALGEGLAGWVAQERQSIYIPDVREDQRWYFFPETDQGIISAICAPILDGNKAIGTLSVHHTQVNAFSNGHLALLDAICQQVALAFHNAKRYQAIDHLVDRLGSQQYRLESLIKELPVGVLLLSRAHNLITANTLGHDYISEIAGAGIGDKIENLGQYPLPELLNRHEQDVPVAISTDGESKRQFEVHARSIPAENTSEWLLTIREVTEERKIQERVQMQDRLATVGQMAAGIAHDFNNIMAAIVVYADLLKMESNLSPVSEERITIIQEQVQRASSLIRQILDFSRRSVMEQIPLDLLPFVKEIEKLLRRMLPETIKTRLIHDMDKYMVFADLTRLQQVLMNLAVNARDAMPNGGTLQFVLDTFILAEGEVPPQADLIPGEWVHLSISDTGEGIASENLAHVFEPFFTTKGVGKGTGLGLAQVYGIVKQHGGYIDIDSQLGKGTTFNIYLPALVAESASEVKEEEIVTFTGSGKKVILAEDDAPTRAAVRALLEAHQFEVLTASNGVETLKLLEDNAARITLIVSDIVMPEMGGLEMSEIVGARWPDIKILFITGHPLEDASLARLSSGQFAWLEKPFSVQSLRQAIQKLLE